MRPLALFAVVSVSSLVTVLALGTDDGRPSPAVAQAARPVTPSGQPYGLVELAVLADAFDKVEESYVEPGRIDPDAMYTEALEAVERLLPQVMFDRDGATLRATVGEERRTLPVPPITDLEDLEAALREVAVLLEDHVPRGALPTRPGHDAPDPLAIVEYALVNGALSTLDPHSALLPPDQSKEMDVENRGEFGGLGINIQVLDGGRLVIEHPIPETPAAYAGLLAGDHIRRIDGTSTINLSLDEAVELLRGPIGASVDLEIVREGVDEPFHVTVHRGRIKLNPVEAHPLPGNVGYVRIPSFHSSVSADLRTELARLAREDGGLRGLVLDLRDNPGGYLNQAVAVADLFLSEGEIVATRGPHDRRAKIERAQAKGTEDAYPMVVLVNASSASASEIVAGALRNNDRAVVVGERTFGKGSVQNLHDLEHDTKLKVTIARYLTPGGQSIQSVGIPADIELVPSVVGMWRGPDGHEEPEASLFGRELVRREADLDAHLDLVDDRAERPTYRVRYHRPWAVEFDPFARPDLEVDTELRFALDLLRVARSPYRGDMLAAAAPLVQRWADDGHEALDGALETLGVDWREGPAVPAPSLTVALDVGEDGVLQAGEDERMALVVTNEGDQPLHRLVAVATDHELLDGHEFVIGHLPPGATARVPARVWVDAGYPSEVAPVTISIRDGSDHEVLRAEPRLRVQGRPPAVLSWSWEVLAPEDGRIDVDDVVPIQVTVVNDGAGPATGAEARIKNRSGRALDVVAGTIEAGRRVDAAGEACVPSSPGWEGGQAVGAGPDHPRVRSRRPPVWPEGCTRVLAPGERWTGVVEVQVLEELAAGYAVELSIADRGGFDVGAILRGGFHDYLEHVETVRFGLGSPPAASTVRHPPRIEVSLAPALETPSGRVSLSGRVVDDAGVSHVVVYADDDQVAYLDGEVGGGGRTAVPFHAEVPIDEGVHTLSILAKDRDGFVAATSRVVFRREDRRTAQAALGDER